VIFNTFAYFFLFLLPAVVCFRLAARAARPWILAAFGMAFYVYFSLTSVGGVPGALCALLILYQSLCCVYLCKPGSKACIFVIVQAVIALCVFKYMNFFGGLVFGKPENSPLYWKDAFLPLGISFFTFEFIHYAADRYRAKADDYPTGDVLAFILFFPTMVAGPIKRAQEFIPKLAADNAEWATDWNRGVTRILIGLAKKFVVADLLTALTNHLNATDVAGATGRHVLLLWIFAYGIKIYFDFSAYSDIAIGSARLFGIRVPENFNAPYLATNISEFWRNWHISLSRWLIDYVFIPLGGSRVAPAKIYRNLIVVMLVSGVWHGAGLNFVVWGAWHAALLCLHRLAAGWRASRLPEGEAGSLTGIGRVAAWAVTFVSVNLGWAFFAMDFNTALLFFRRLFLG
jgi:alginate O-acetyltransferase complex protein AlgI